MDPYALMRTAVIVGAILLTLSIGVLYMLTETTTD